MERFTFVADHRNDFQAIITIAGADMDIDLDHLLAMAGGDPELADEVLDIFRNQAASWGRLLDASLPAQQWADAAHTLKGAALSIGAHELARACQAAEALGRSGDASHIQAATLISDVKTGLAVTLEACARASHELSKPGLRASKDENS
ncbi:MAG: Hpt domain-containing protein [Henriciella sp.]|nr:Hpt domain-containing protein [Henriciella sp.]